MSLPGAARRSFIAGVASLLCGCAGIEPAPHPPRPPAGSVAIVAAREAPATNLVAFAKDIPTGVAQGAVLEGATTGGTMAVAIAGSSGLGAATLAFIAPYAIVAGAVAGGVTGALISLPADKTKEIETALRDALQRLDMQRALAERTAEAARRDTRVVVRDDGTADTEIDVAVKEVGFEHCQREAVAWFPRCGNRKDPAVALFLIAEYRLSAAAQRTPLHARTLRFASPRRAFSRWAADDGKLLVETFEQAYRELAGAIVDDALLAPPFEWPEFKSFGRLPGDDARYGLCGLAPQEPKAEPVLLSEALKAVVSRPKDFCPFPLRFSRVDSLQPTLRWEPFPRPLDRERLDAAVLPKVADVRYDVRVWEAERCQRGALVAEGSGLERPEYRVENALQAGRRYMWSFRARFDVDGQTLATRWSSFDPSHCVATEVPPAQAHRFVTPGR